jgi:UDP-N-acetylmuramoyl-L-alanyl-D-glutamate--2,6-diaminopimelate ligase
MSQCSAADVAANSIVGANLFARAADILRMNSHLPPITRLATDSRAVQVGDTFLAYRGEHADGRDFIAQAIANGANAVLWDAQNFVWNAAWNVSNLAVPNLREQSGEIAALVYGQPAQKLWMLGITGTNGKTSCSHWLGQTFTALGKKTALIGTLGNGFQTGLQPTLNTTPDAPRSHALLAEFVAQGAEAVAMEVSSHALEQGRVNGMKFDVALFTNLSRDHLDYHGDMASYAAAKRRLFDFPQLKFAVLNMNDAFGAEWAQQLQDSAVEVVGYGMSDAALRLAERLGVRMVFGGDVAMSAAGCQVQIHSSWGGGVLHSPLIGRFNVANLLGVLAVLLVSEVSLSDALGALAKCRAVAGRMQTLGGAGKPSVVVDYAHTPDALEKVLQTLREVTAHEGGKLRCVFGCGGDRDRGKRPLMGAAASKFADVCIVTSDNPRSENPHDIIAAIVSGMSAQAEIVEDRAAAIAHAIASAQANDTVLLAGKGHEEYQEIHGVKTPFSDVTTAQAALSAWRMQT